MKNITSCFFALLHGSAAYACDFCSPVVFLDQERASCFISIYDTRLEKLVQSKRGFVEIDLDGCNGQHEPRSKSVVQSPGDPDFADGAKIYLDKNGMKCLRDTIQSEPGSFDPNRVLKLSTLCEGESG